MSFNKQSLFIFLWAIYSLGVFIAARYTEFPNQAYVIYGVVLTFLATLVFRDIVNVTFVQLKWLALPLAYALTFIIVSYFGIDFEQSIKYQVLYLPLVITIDFFLAFIIGFKFRETTIAKYALIAGGLSTFYLLTEAFLFPSTRMGGLDLDVAMVVPLAVLFGAKPMALAALFVLIASTKKTITVVALLAFAGAYWLNSRNGAKAAGAVKPSVFATWLRRVAGAVAVIAVVGYFAQNIQTTYERLTFEGDGDPMRTAISTVSFDMLEEHFPWGIGLGGFSSASQSQINYQTYDARGEIVVGANLHSSYMTWALEGGLPILLIVLALFFFAVRAIWYLQKNDESRMFALVLLIWLLQGMLFGMFHQWHNTHPFWALFGLVFGCYERHRRAA